MSLKGLFDSVAVTKIVDNKTSEEIGRVVESADYHEADIIDEKRFIPSIDFSEPKNFAKYGSAEKYYEDSYTYIHSSYPYDGSLAEKLQWKNSGSYIDLYTFENKYPRTNGYINFSYGGWGSHGTAPAWPGTAGYGTPKTEDLEYISLNGGPGLGGGIQSQSANVWNPTNNRESNLEVDLTEGVTIEFWLKKDAFTTANTEKEVVLDLWNNELSSSDSYGRLRLEVTGAAGKDSNWLLTMVSGTNGVQWQTLGNTGLSSLTDGNWHHYAFSLLSASAGITAKSYTDGVPQKEETLGSTGINKIRGPMQAQLGALITSVSGNIYHGLHMTGSGKLSASLDEFRYWKTQRSSEKVGRYWFTQVGGGTNTDLANTDLGVYYKFNEGITQTASVDSVILDYSGRVTNGTWTGYTAGSRNTGSAMVSASAAATEFLDPIVYPTHPDVISTLASLKALGSVHDTENPSELFGFFPSWMQDQDPVHGDELKKLTQIISSYLDTLYLQIESFGSIHDIAYLSGSATKANTLTEQLLSSRGLLAPELFLDADILEKLGDRSEEREYRDSLTNIKNKIYQNIYNNLVNIYKTKGTRQSFRNVLRCFGVDEKLYKLNVYGDNVQFNIRNNRELYSANKRYIDFSVNTNFDSTVYLFSNDTNSVSYLSSSSELTSGYASTLETYVFFPKKPEAFERAYSDYQYNYLTSSLFGQHTVRKTNPNSLAWDTPDSANFQVYAVRDIIGSKDAKFVLTSSAGGVITSPLSTSFYDDVYLNTNWIFGVTIKPAQYPLVNHIYGTKTSDYIIEFKGTQVAAGEVLDSFIVTGSIDASQAGYGFITGSKRPYIGAHRQDYNGETLTRSDVRVGFCRYWLDDITLGLLEDHGRDVQNYGTKNPTRNPYLFQNNQTINSEFLEIDTLALNWDFETVTGSDASGEFTVPDFSSGSTLAQATQFGALGNLLGAQHTGYGYGFPVSSTASIDADYVLTSELLDFERLNSSDMISILDVQDDIEFTRESRPINFLYAIEKSMYQSVSENMVRMFAVITDFNNIIGSPANKYRDTYKGLRILREKFFARVENTPDLDKYVEFYKWFDSSLSRILEQLIPAGAEFSKEIRNVVESHMLERSKYQHKFPTMELKDPVLVGTILTPLPLSPGWQYTHHPINDKEDTNANYWKTLASRDKGKLATSDTALNSNKQIYFDNSTKERRTRKEKNVYRFIADRRRNIRAGTTTHENKIVNFVFDATAPYGPVVPGTNIPQNIMLSFNTDVEQFQDIVDDLEPGKKRRVGFGIDPTINIAAGKLKQDGNILAPFSLYSSSVTNGYNSKIVDHYNSNILLTNLHEDIVYSAETRPLQGPFTEKFVGGRQYRHTELNSASYVPNYGGKPYFVLDTRFDRAEGFRVELGLFSVHPPHPGALGIVPPNYPFSTSPSGSAPHGFLAHLPTAQRLRDEGAKRSVNIKNILMTTASVGVRLSGTLIHNKIGNYSKNYQVVQSNARTNNDLYFREQSFSFATNPLASNQTIRGRFPLSNDDSSPASPNVGWAEHTLPDRSGINSNQTIIVNRFSAPGGYNSISRGYLDPAHEEKSVYSVLPYRNLSVLNFGTIVSASNDESVGLTMHVDDESIDDGVDRGLRQRLVPHNEPFGYDGAYTAYPAYYKVNRNPRVRVTDSGGNEKKVYDNYFVHHPIPRTTRQYSWINRSWDEANSATSTARWGYAELSGGYFVSSLPTISQSMAYGNLPFVYMNAYQGLIDPVTASSNTLGFSTSSPVTDYRNLDWWGMVIPTAWNNAVFNSLMLRRNGPYGYPSWKQIRTEEHPVVRNQEKNSILSIRTKTSTDIRIGSPRGNALTQFIEPQVYASEFPMIHEFNIGSTLQSGRTPGRPLRLTLKNSYGNKLINFANYEVNNILNVTRNYDSGDLYFNRINTMILKGQNNDEGLKSALSKIGVTYAQTVYPATYNSFLERTRSRKYYSILDIWNDKRIKRSWGSLRNSQGTIIRGDQFPYGMWNEPSVWPVDGHLNYSSSVSWSEDDGAGELQNSYSRYRVLDTLAKSHHIYTIIPGATYNARVPHGEVSASTPGGNRVAFPGDRYNLVAGSFSGTLGRAGSGKVPYKNYEDYAKYLRLIGKDYSIVPEFRISEHIAEFLTGDDFATLTNIDDLLSLTGSAYVNSSESGFYKEYANSDFMKMFSVVNNTYHGAELVDGSKMSQDKIGLRCSALVQFLPYKGFYPAERTVQLASLFSQSFGDEIYVSASGKAQKACYRAILEPLYSQGIMYNTIKSGIAVSNFIISNTSSSPQEIFPMAYQWATGAIGDSTRIVGDLKGPSSGLSASCVYNDYNASLPEGNLFFRQMLPPWSSRNGAASSSYLNENGYFHQKIPFEALYKPRNYLSQDYISYTGRIYDTGLSSASLNTIEPTSDTSNWLTWNGEGDSRYELAIDNFLCETVNFFQNGLTSILSDREENFRAAQSGSVYTMKLKLYRPTTISPGYDWANTGALIPDHAKFDMYRRISAFGPPVAAKTWDAMIGYSGSASYGTSFSHLTPPYYAGSGSCTFTFTATDDGTPSLDEIFAGTSLEYDRMETVRLVNGNQPMGDYKVQMYDSFNLTESVSSVPERSTVQKKQWLIQSKFETPIINISGDRRTCGTDQTAGATATGEVALTSSVLSSAFSTGYIELTGSSWGAVDATGSVEFMNVPNDTKFLYFTGSSGTAYQYIPTAGPTQPVDESNNLWYFNTGSDAGKAAEELFGAMTASNFVAVDGATVTRVSERIAITASSGAGSSGNFLIVDAGIGEVAVSGMSGGADVTHSITEDDQWTISDGGTDGGAATSLIFALTASGGSCPGAAEACALIDITNTTTTANGLAAKINNVDGLNITASVTGTVGVKTNARIILTNNTTGSAGNVTITATTSSNGDGYQEISGMAGGANAVYSLVTMDRFTLSDGGTDGGTTSATFKLKTGASAADEAELVAYNAATSATNLIAKINAYTDLGVTASPGAGNSADTAFITLTNDNTGSDGNVTIGLIVDDAAYWAASGMAGGVTYEAADPCGDVYGKIAIASAPDTIFPAASINMTGNLGNTITPNSELFTQGLWHDYGSIPTGSDEGVFAIIESPSPKIGKSLAELVGMPIGQPFRIGAIKPRAILEEAVVAVPFFVGGDTRRKFYKLDSLSQNSVKKLSRHMKKYIFPPRFDFVLNDEMDPVAMYVFEFSRQIDQQDIADMWQNLPPSIHETFEQKVSTIEHKLLRDQMLNKENRKLRKDLRWLVFKVKKRAETDYSRFTKKGLVEDLETIPSNIGNAKYSYNWPYDYFSLVELVKIDEAIEYDSQLPPDSRVAIVGEVNIVEEPVFDELE